MRGGKCHTSYTRCCDVGCLTWWRLDDSWEVASSLFDGSSQEILCVSGHGRKQPYSRWIHRRIGQIAVVKGHQL